MKNKIIYIVVALVILLTIGIIAFFALYNPKEDETPNPVSSKEITEENIEELSNHELQNIFYDDKPYFINFAGIDTDSIPYFSASSKEEAIALLNDAFAFSDLEYVGENNWLYILSFTSEEQENFSEPIYVWKDSVYHTNFGLAEYLPPLFVDRGRVDKFAKPSKEVIKKVYDTIYAERYFEPNTSSKIIASYVEETDTEFIYKLYRVSGGNAFKNQCEYFNFEKLIFTFNKKTGEEISFYMVTINRVELITEDIDGEMLI